MSMGRKISYYAKVIGIFMFFVINFQNISAFNQYNFEQSVDESNGDEYTSHAASREDLYANRLETLGLRLYPGSTFKQNDRSTPGSLNHCKALVYQTLTSLPDEHREHLQHLTLYSAEGRRGLGGGSTIILRCSDVTDKELVSVFVHEMGHVYDTGLETGDVWAGRSEFMDGSIPIYRNDKSLRFYRISWSDEKNLKKDSEKTNFVTGYAMTDPFEDFAETYNYYILHGQQFKQMAKYDKTLRRKYIYMKYFVFEGKEFNFDPYNTGYKLARNYDSTLLNYDYETFLRSNTRQEITAL